MAETRAEGADDEGTGTGGAQPALEDVVLDLPVGPVPVLRSRPAGDVVGRLLLVPGYTGGRVDHRLLVPELAARGVDAVALTQRGQPGAVRPEGEGADVEEAARSYALPLLARDVHDAAAALAALDDGWAAPVHLLGHSFGGVVAGEAALLDPSRWRGLVLLCSGPHGWPGRMADQVAVLEREGTAAALWAHLAAPEGLEPPPDGAAAAWRERVLGTSPGQLLAAARVLGSHEDRSDALRGTGLPVLVAHGETDAAWPQEDQRAMAERVGAAYAVLPGGHSPNEDAPAATAALLAECVRGAAGD
ncbi:alpha/beta fold hydrolase [uncultured Pseudokineococcus sp.]|uniref:alpha/beta fold hydrolase n=1 Tax=uncultured Pseudokineococcus sp. TaxID=1642928 RepID=UPI00260F412D|nr:alpha/beta fold hydrolase [uncultured Pseudokineococcus sp.]